MLKKISLHNILFKKKPLLIIRNEVAIFEDQNFILFNLNETHYKLLKSLYTDKFVKKMLPYKVNTSSEALQFQLKHLINQHLPNKLGFYVIYDKHKHKRIGLLGFHFKGKANTIIELSFMLRAPFRRLGLGSQICTLACSFAIQHNLNHLNAITLHNNIAAQKTLLKSGFLSTGTIHHYTSKYDFVQTFFKDLRLI